MICEMCGKEHNGNYGSGRFCSSACARKFSTFSKRESINMVVSKCLLDKNSNVYYNNPKLCCICNDIIPYQYRRRKTCSEECKGILKKIQFSEYSTLGGLASAKAQKKRSRNEISFCNMCEDYFGQENVVHNETMFNGWDADIILLQYKIAILWNGPWHYRKVTKNHNLLQVQNRDRLKIKEIRACGYVEYIIKDTDKCNENKVIKEFNQLLEQLGLT